MTDQIFKFILDLNKQAADELIKAYYNESNKRTSLIFPKIRNSILARVSEQELRSAFICFHEKSNYRDFSYSVETPTEQPYSFTGKYSKSASTDLSFYQGHTKIINIEFKAHSAKQFSIAKDIEKLVNEDCIGAWCHILRNEDKGTLDELFNKFRNAFTKNDGSILCPKKPLYFSFLILNKRKLITRVGKDKDSLNFNPSSIFDLKYSEYKDFTQDSIIRDWHINVF